jgi:hypothetical protein
MVTKLLYMVIWEQFRRQIKNVVFRVPYALGLHCKPYSDIVKQ